MRSAVAVCIVAVAIYFASQNLDFIISPTEPPLSVDEVFDLVDSRNFGVLAAAIQAKLVDVNTRNKDGRSLLVDIMYQRTTQLMGGFSLPFDNWSAETAVELIVSSPKWKAEDQALFAALSWRNTRFTSAVLAALTPAQLARNCVYEEKGESMNITSALHTSAGSQGPWLARLTLHTPVADRATRSWLHDLLDVEPLVDGSVRQLTLDTMAEAPGASALVAALVAGCPVDATDSAGNTVLHTAVDARRTRAVRAIVEAAAGGVRPSLQDELGIALFKRNSLGLTPLHMARRTGNGDMVAVLLALAGPRAAELEAVHDAFGRTAAELWELHAAPVQRAVDSRARGVARGEVSRALSESLGWRPQPPADEDHLHAPHAACEIDVIECDGLENAEIMRRFTAGHMSLMRPVLLRGCGARGGINASFSLRRDDFVEAFKGETARVAAAAYGLGYSATARHLSVAEFNEVLHAQAPRGINGTRDVYISLMEDGSLFQTLLGEFPWALLSRAVQVVENEFIIGGRYSGAKPHYHWHALNIVLFGAKIWSVYDSAFTDSRTSLECFQDPALPALRCVQNAGDIMFVPALQGHAVLNLGETAAFAIEFSL